MSIQITLTPEEERKLAQLARARGKDLASHARDVVTAYLNGAAHDHEKTFDEILTPLREGWQQSGLSEDEITALFEEARSEVRQERRAQKGMP